MMTYLYFMDLLTMEPISKGQKSSDASWDLFGGLLVMNINSRKFSSGALLRWESF